MKYYIGLHTVHKPSEQSLSVFHQQLRIMSHNFFVKKQKEFLEKYCIFLKHVVLKLYKLEKEHK